MAAFLCSHFVGILTFLAPDEWACPKACQMHMPGGLENAGEVWIVADAVSSAGEGIMECVGCGAGGCGSLGGGGVGGTPDSWGRLEPSVSMGRPLHCHLGISLPFSVFMNHSLLGFSMSEVPCTRSRASGWGPHQGGERPWTPSDQHLPFIAVAAKAREIKRMILRGGRTRTPAFRPPQWPLALSSHTCDF